MVAVGGKRLQVIVQAPEGSPVGNGLEGAVVEPLQDSRAGSVEVASPASVVR